MTALSEYDRLEATGLWRASSGAQRQDVVVSVGDATLQIFEPNGTARAHWSLAAIERLNPGKEPAQYGPGDDSGEDLEIEDATMVAAIEKVRKAVNRAQPKPGRLRGRIILGAVLAGIALLVFWVPGAMVGYASKTVPPVARSEIGLQLLGQVERIAGLPCRDAGGPGVLAELGDRLNLPDDTQLLVFRSGLRETTHLPGGPILIASWTLEDFETPDVPAGFILAEAERRSDHDPLARLLNWAGFGATFRLLTTGALPEMTLQRYAEALMTAPRIPVPDRRLLDRFQATEVASAPYAYALDVTGEKTVRLIEADPFGGTSPQPILTDDAWVALQGICGN